MENWKKWLLLGILSSAFGVFALGNAVAASVAVTLVTGAMFILAGGVEIVIGLGEEGAGRKLFATGLGVLMVILGVSFLANPLQGMVSLALIVTVLLAANGILRIGAAWAMRDTAFFWAMLLSGAMSILLAGYIMANFAAASVALLGILLGVELLFNGAGLIAMALFVRAHR